MPAERLSAATFYPVFKRKNPINEFEFCLPPPVDEEGLKVVAC